MQGYPSMHFWSTFVMLDESVDRDDMFVNRATPGHSFHPRALKMAPASPLGNHNRASGEHFAGRAKQRVHGRCLMAPWTTS
jgi:hypothetical protein